MFVVEVSSFQLALQESFHPIVSVLLNVGARSPGLARHVRGLRGGEGARSMRGSRARTCTSATATIRWRRRSPRERRARSAGSGRDRPTRARSATWATSSSPTWTACTGWARSTASGRGIARTRPPRPPSRSPMGSHRPPWRPRCPGSIRGLTAVRSSPTVDGVRFVDNSKATNVHAAAAAIDGAGDAVLIAGGRAKGVDLSPLRAHAGRLRAVIAIGESAADVVSVFEGSVPDGHRRVDRGGRAGCLRRRRAGGDRPSGAGVRQLGSVRELRRARGPVRGGGEVVARGGGCPWLTARSLVAARSPPPAGSHLRLVQASDLMRLHADTERPSRVGTSRSCSRRRLCSR